MKFGEIIRFELAYQIRRPWTWLCALAVTAVVFLMVKGSAVNDATFTDTWMNSPFTASMATVIACLVWLLTAAPVAGEAAARDSATLMHPLTYTAPISKAEYLGGRFLAAFALNAMILFGVTVGILLAAYRPGAPEVAVGPFRLAALLNPYALVALPNAFAATAIQFSIATLSRRPMAAYLGSVLVFFMAYVVGLVVAFAFGRPDLSEILDPIGPFFIIEELTSSWTPIEKNNRLLALEGGLLRNRLLWTGIGLGALAYTHLRFRFVHHVAGSWWRRFLRRPDARAPIPAGAAIATAPISVPSVPQSFGLGAGARQMLAIAWASLRMITRMRGGLDALVAISILIVVVQPFSLETAGVPLIPRTWRVLADLTTPLTNFATPFALVPLLIVFWAGELVWRERDAGLGEITDASPVPEWALFLGKLLGLGVMLVAFMALLTIAGILVQVRMGYFEFEIGRYLQILFGFQLTEYLLFAVLALVVHVLANQKYFGHLVALVIYAVIAMSALMGLEHKLLIYGASPAWSYTEMRGFGPSVGPWLWVKLHWVAWALLLGLGGLLLWARGREGGFAVRLRLAQRRLTRATVGMAVAAAALVLAVGGFVFYNTNVLHPYVTEADENRIKGEYERRYARYENAPQPRIEHTSLRVELYPERPAATIRGTYVLVNRDAVAIDSIHVAPAIGRNTGPITFDRSATRHSADEEHFHHIYTLAEPLQPGDSLRMDFEVRHEPRGFTNTGASTVVVDNGTYFALAFWLPGIGYQSSRELMMADDRREQRLPPQPVIPTLEDEKALNAVAERTMFEVVVGTSADEIAVAPGALRRSWSEGGRRYFHYATDAPIGGDKPILSSAYAVHEERWSPSAGAGQPVTIRIYYHPEHASIVDRVLRSVRASLEYGTKHFGPYPFGHVSVAERAAVGLGLSAESGNIDYSEQFALFNPDDQHDFDFPFAVVGHEMGHNFGVPYAIVEGVPVMGESLAWYTGMAVLEHEYGREHLDRLRAFMREPHPYPPIRQSAPLIRGLDPWAGYRRGPFALFALREYVGEEPVNGALRRLREKHGSGKPPLATTLDLYRELQAATPDSLQYLLRDLFAQNTFWELGVEGKAKPAEGESWQVTLNITARKVVVDSAGRETEVPMDDLVDVGVFASPEIRQPKDPLYFQRQRIRSGKHTITLTVPRKPARIGIDPYHLLLDLDANDNFEPLEIQQ